MKTSWQRLHRDARCAVLLVLPSLSCAHRGTQHGSQEVATEPAPSASPAPATAPSMDAAIGVVTASDASLPDAISPAVERAALLRESAPGKDLLASPLQNDNPHELVRARCLQQERCGMVGHGKRYMSPEQCQTVILEEQRDRLVRYSCPRSTAGSVLQDCLEALRMADCAQAFTSFDRIEACASSRICQGSNSTLPAP
jgi:hypothetical protein